MTEDSIDALYKRAECYQSAGIMKYACMDWSFCHLRDSSVQRNCIGKIVKNRVMSH
jgi:hypothetical protein